MSTIFKGNIQINSLTTILAGVLLVLQACFQMIEGHGRMLEPPARNTLWRFGYKAPPNYNDNELFCGGIRGITVNKGKCGICGDPYDGARLHETGGPMALNLTTRNYFPGSSIDVLIEIIANHGGLFRFDICWRNDVNEIETEECFEELQLTGKPKILTKKSPEDIQDDFDERFDWELSANAGLGMFAISVDLPFNKTCEHCILRWHWTVANNWGTCDDGTGAVGCGYQEVYRNCADISVSRSGAGVGIGMQNKRRRRRRQAALISTL